jgi:hypothetical protein
MRRWGNMAEVLAWGWETRRVGQMGGIWNGEAAVGGRESKIGLREREEMVRFYDAS